MDKYSDTEIELIICENKRLKNALHKLAGSEAFYVAGMNITPELKARQDFARFVIQGMGVDDAFELSGEIQKRILTQNA